MSLGVPGVYHDTVSLSTPFLQNFSSAGRSPVGGNFLKNFSWTFSGGISRTIRPRRHTKNPAIMQPPSDPGLCAHANMKGRIIPPAPQQTRPEITRKRTHKAAAKDPPPSRREKRGGAFQVAADHADKGRPASKLYAHARTHQHNTHAEHRHTQRHTPKKKPPDCQPEKHTPRNPGESGKHQTPANENTSKRKHQNPKHGPPAGDSIHRARVPPDQFPRARARKGTARAGALIAGRYAQNFPRFGVKKPLPPAMGRALEGG